MPCSTAAACSAGNASSSRNAVMNCAQTKKGRRNHVMPGARSWMIVAMKFIAPSSDEKISSSMPTSHHVWPWPVRYPTAARTTSSRELAAPPGTKKLASMTSAAGEIQPVAGRVQPRERHVGRANLQRDDVVAERAEGQRHDAEEHHDGAVHGAELVVELGRDDAAGRVRSRRGGRR